MPHISSQPSVLLVEDTASLAMIYQQYLKDEDIFFEHVVNGHEAIDIIRRSPPDLVLLDLGLPDIEGIEILKIVNDEKIPSKVVVITADNAIETVVEVMRMGALDFLEKPFDAKRLRTTTRNALRQAQMDNYIADLQSTFDRNRYHGFIGASLPMQAVYRIIDSAAPSKATVFITGESGSGKEVCAEAIHRQSPRAKSPFIALNCGAIPRELMESEIFGHTKGAFTGAVSDRKGAATEADGGTLFLDEIAEMDMDLQTKLLRFIQTGKFKKVGGNKEEYVDIRIVCATNKDPLKAVSEGRFREDLYYRLHVIPVHLPALRERQEDILDIALFFLEKYAGEEGKNFKTFSPEAAHVFTTYNWPGNVRQLQNIIRNIVVLHNAEQVELEHLPAPLNTSYSPEQLLKLPARPLGNVESREEEPVVSDSPDLSDIAFVIKPLAQVEREAIEKAIDFCEGNIPRAAALLEVSPSTIYRKKTGWSDD